MPSALDTSPAVSAPTSRTGISRSLTPARRRARRAYPCLALAVAVTVGLSGCVAGGDSGNGADALPQIGVGRDGAILLPPFPVPRVPDVTSLTADAVRAEKLIAGAGGPPAGLSVTGARCDGDGNVVNRTGAAITSADDGSQVVTRTGVKQVSPDGSGQFSSAGVVYQVEADGSGQVTSRDAVLQVEADGSGQYTRGAETYQVEADGSGQYTRGKETYQVDADGSGQWTGPLGTVQNGGDGEGTWTNPRGVITVAGDGTGTLNGQAIKIAAMPKFALLGRLPKLTRLGQIGKPCGTLIRMDAEVLFDFDKATLRPDAERTLAAVAKALAGARAAVDVNAHTDSKGSGSYNLDLSKKRARAVIAALRAAGTTAKLVPHGYGESQPVAPNTLRGKDNPAGRQLNRRVEIVIPPTG
jgi:OmpA-OmpF porin, OOP family